MTGKFSGTLPIVAAIAIGLGSVAASGTPSSSVSYSSVHASAGDKLFASKCAACHGEHLEGGAGPALTGPTLNTLAKNTKLTVGDMFTFISQQMPLNERASLTHDQYVSIMAYILHFNGYKAGSTPLTYDGATKSPTVVRSLK
jgi:polar amino acid transport system substrate-binding protein